MGTQPQRRPPTTVIRNARLVGVGTRAPTREPVDLRICGGVVREVAPSVRPGAGDAVVDAAGRWAAPGLWDQHVHLSLWARSQTQLDVSGAGSPDAVLALVADRLDRVREQPGRSVLTGFGFRAATWGRQPTVAELDAVSGACPVVLTSGDGHSGWLSSAALQLLRQGPRQDLVRENEWFALQDDIAALAEPDETEDAVRAAVAAAAALGVVGVVDVEMAPGYLQWPERAARGIDRLRVRAATYPDRLDDVVAAGLRTGDPLSAHTPLLTMGPLKVISDGSLNTRTAYCCEPYADAHDPGAPRGAGNYSPDALVGLLARGHEAGLGAAVHAIGDAAVAIALDAFERTGARGSIEHAQLVRHEDLPRMARLGVTASVQPAHLLDDREVTEQCWPDRADRCFALRSMLRAGVRMALGSDAPVAPLDPWLAMAAAVHRGRDGREQWTPAEALTAGEALAASTDGQTTLARGSRADLVLLSDDPTRDVGGSAAVSAHLRGITVDATLVAGRPTHLALG